MRPVAILMLLAVSCFKSYAQPGNVRDQKPGLNTVYLELGGPLGEYGVNYERQIPIKNGIGIAVSAGVCPKSLGILGDDIWGANLAVKGIYQKGRNKFTVGGGVTRTVYGIQFPERRQTIPEVDAFALLGYSRVTKSSFVWGIYYTPVASVTGYTEIIWYWPAIQLGYNF